MCGFAGILNFDRAPVDKKILARMGDILKHRGPDGQGTFLDEGFGLIHRRLAIIDRKQSIQPWTTPNRRITLAANHEIYNFEELKAHFLPRVNFRTSGDTEVIAEGFQKDGTDFFSKMVGMYALAAWDSASRQLWVARDPFGIKPLYYFETRHCFVFASELKALLAHPACPRTLSGRALDGYLANLAVPEPFSILEGVHQVPAGHFLRVDKKAGAPTAFWNFPESRPENLSVSQLGKLIEENVALCMRADVPVGIFLSGGVDSTALTIAAQKITDGATRTFSVKFQEPQFDESEFSRLVAQRLETQHTEVLFTDQDAAKSADFLSTHLDEPFADASLLPTYFLSRTAKESVGVVLSGEGADELFAGSPWHWSHPASFQPRRSFMPDVFPSRAQKTFKADSLQHALRHDLKTYLPSDLLHKLDRATMAVSLEARVPFLNHPFAERVLRIPPTQLISAREGKKLLKRYVSELLPAKIVKRPKKGFSIPLDIWLFKDGPFRELILDTLCSRGAIASRFPLKKMIQEHDRLENLHGYRLWTLFILERWLKSNHIEAPAI